MVQGIVIVIGGLHGTGKTTCAKLLAEKLGLRYVSAGGIFRAIAKKKGMAIEEFSNYAENHHEIDREVDSRVIQASKRGGVVLEGQITANLVDSPDLKIFLTAPESVRIDRLSSRDGKTKEESLRETRIREVSERKRYRETYGIDVTDLSGYNLIIDTSKWLAESVTAIIQTAIDEYLRGKA
jgi:cytidylate kinase